MLDWSIVLAFVTAAAAIIALALTTLQIRQSNKQVLFDRRIALWTVAQGLMQLFERNHNQFEGKEDGPFFSNDLLFTWLTNNTFLNDIAPTLDHTLEPSFQFIFLRKLEELRSFSAEAELIFKGQVALYMSKFFDSYQALLFSMYQYQILIDHLTEDANRFQWALEGAIQRLDEPMHRKYLFEAYETLLASYTAFGDEATQKKIKRQIRLS